MMKKIPKASLLLILLGLMSLPFARCARNTLGEQYDDGRLYFIIDLNPDWFGPSSSGKIKYQGYVEIKYTIEGEEPVVSEPYQYSIKDLSGQKFDLVGKSIEGGLEVQVRVVTSQTSVEFYVPPLRDEDLKYNPPLTFKMDGNITLRFRLKEQEIWSSQLILVME